MDHTRAIRALLTLCGCLTALLVHAQTTTFTYQGRLTDQGAAANGSYDLQFTLQDAAVNGNAIGSPVRVAPLVVANGLFTTPLDFGASAFTGADRWLEISVRTNGSALGYTTLTPRQKI